VVIADTSVWIEYLRGGDEGPRAALRDLIRTEQVALVGVVLAELLQGCRTPKESGAILAEVTSLQFLEAGFSAWRRTGELSASLRSSGITLPLSDILIAALALEHACQVYTLDPHFAQIPGLPLYRPMKNRVRGL
jgi:predicted nucleic acid-binding protein